MTRTSRYAFLLAKIYGILARSFVGTNYRDIVRLRTVTELYDRLYPGERREAPEYQLTADLERRAAEEAVRTMRVRARAARRPAPSCSCTSCGATST